MKKLFKAEEFIILVLVIIAGSISQPLLAYGYMLLGDYINLINIDGVIKIVTIMIVSFLGIGLYYFVSTYIRNNIARRLKDNVFKGILNIDLSDILSKDLSEYVNLINLKIESWSDMYLSSIFFVAKDVLQIVFMVLLLINISPKIAVVVLIFILPLMINNIFFPKMMNKRVYKYFDSQDRQLAEINDIMQGVVVVKNSGVESYFENKMAAIFNQTTKDVQALSFLENISGFVANCGVALSQISGVALSIVFLNNGSITLGQFMAVLQLTFFLNEPFIAVINNVMKVISMRELNKEIVRSLPKEIRKNDIITRLINITDEIDNIELKDLNFKYVDKFVFKENLNYKFEKGKKYLIKGESGSGKSSLSKLMLKLHNYTSGDILVGEKSYKDLSADDINSIINYIGQDPYIFNITLKENIDLKGKLSDDEVISIIKKVRLDKLMNELGGIYGNINKTKRQISGGESARIAIARALADNKPIIIADEVLANLDAENSQNIEKLLLDLDNSILINICHHHNENLANRYNGELLL
ncbi:MAG: ATP-binding cassette domain-containing protein [Filifactoraceae bacterium]